MDKFRNLVIGFGNGTDWQEFLRAVVNDLEALREKVNELAAEEADVDELDELETKDWQED